MWSKDYFIVPSVAAEQTILVIFQNNVGENTIAYAGLSLKFPSLLFSLFVIGNSFKHDRFPIDDGV